MHRVRLAVRENRLTSRITEEDYIPAIEETGRGWVVEVDGGVVGFAVGNAATGNIWALFVDPAHEGQGHGRRLHDAMVEWLFSRGLERLWLSTDPNTRAHRFYESAGWRHTGMLANGEATFERHAPIGPHPMPGRSGGMIKFDHLRIPVTDLARSRDWYIRTLGLKVEFEVPDRQTVALQDSDGFTIFLQEVPPPVVPNQCALWFQVTDVDTMFTDWSARGVEFAHSPRKSYWGYGAELVDPDGYLIRLWDQHSMKAK